MARVDEEFKVYYVAVDVETLEMCGHKHIRSARADRCGQAWERYYKTKGRKSEWQTYRVTKESLVHGVERLQRDIGLYSKDAKA